jgi:hypothetical protein
MKYDIKVNGFHSRSGKMVVARYLTSDEEIPFRKALTMVEHLPVVLMRGVDEKEVASRLDQYRKLGVDVTAVESGGAEGPRRQPKPPRDEPPVQNAPAETTVEPAPAAPQDVPKPSAPDPAAPAPTAGRGIPVPPEPVETAQRQNLQRRSRAGHARGLFILAGIIVFAASGIAILTRSGHRFSTKLSRVLVDGGVRKGDSVISAVPRVSRQRTAPAKKSRDEEEDVLPAARVRAQSFIDSAEACGSDPNAAIRFFQMAIAFNRHNIHAWYGLIEAYRAAGHGIEAEKARAEMEGLFGETAFSMERLVKPFGVLKEYRLSNDGIGSVEYRSRAAGDRKKLAREAYAIARALKIMGTCRSLSVVADAGSAGSMVAYCGALQSFESTEQFMSVSKISFLSKSAGVQDAHEATRQ